MSGKRRNSQATTDRLRRLYTDEVRETRTLDRDANRAFRQWRKEVREQGARALVSVPRPPPKPARNENRSGKVPERMRRSDYRGPVIEGETGKVRPAHRVPVVRGEKQLQAALEGMVSPTQRVMAQDSAKRVLRAAGSALKGGINASFNPLFDLAGDVIGKSPLQYFNPDPLAPPVTPPGWAIQRNCTPYSAINACTLQQTNCGTSTNCLSGQAVNWSELPTVLGPNATRYTVGRGYYNSSGSKRAEHEIWYIRSPCVATTSTKQRIVRKETFIVPGVSERNPNITRHLPGTRPMPSPAEMIEAEARAMADIFPERAVASITSTSTRGAGRFMPPPTSVMGMPVTPRGRDKKTISLGARIFKGLDNLSEWAENVDAVFESLPPEVRKGKCGRATKRGLLDNAGQYGIDQADCKLRVIFDNWRLVDAELAWKKIAGNVLEDQIHGAVHKRLPRNTVSALKDNQQAFGTGVNDALEWLFGV